MIAVPAGFNMQMQVEHILSCGLPIRQNQIYALTSGCCPHSARNVPRALENRCACLVVQVFKAGKVLQWNNQRMPLKRKQGHDMVILKKNVSGSVTGNY
jgi:hypothetical protein